MHSIEGAELHMRVSIHRGAKQIGDTCVEIEASGSRIIVDLGLPLNVEEEADLALVPEISGLRKHDPSLLVVVPSHEHRDHWGLIPTVQPGIPLVMSKAVESIMRAAAPFMPDSFAPKAWKYLESEKPLQIGPFTVTPHVVDHSGFDAYALEIEAGGPARAWPKGQAVRAIIEKTAEERRCDADGGIEPRPARR
jgi:ribonuclease J